MTYVAPEKITMIIAGDDFVRKETAVDEEKMYLFMDKEIRPEFDNNDIIAVKFIVINGGDTAETNWIINPFYEDAENYFEQLAPEFIPEIIFIHHWKNVLLEYDGFYHAVIDYSSTINTNPKEVYESFINFLNKED